MLIEVSEECQAKISAEFGYIWCKNNMFYCPNFSCTWFFPSFQLTSVTFKKLKIKKTEASRFVDNQLGTHLM